MVIVNWNILPKNCYYSIILETNINNALTSPDMFFGKKTLHIQAQTILVNWQIHLSDWTSIVKEMLSSRLFNSLFFFYSFVNYLFL